VREIGAENEEEAASGHLAEREGTYRIFIMGYSSIKPIRKSAHRVHQSEQVPYHVDCSMTPVSTETGGIPD
jgi:hypothetical protein